MQSNNRILLQKTENNGGETEVIQNLIIAEGGKILLKADEIIEQGDCYIVRNGSTYALYDQKLEKVSVDYDKITAYEEY